MKEWPRGRKNTNRGALFYGGNGPAQADLHIGTGAGLNLAAGASGQLWPEWKCNYLLTNPPVRCLTLG